MKTEQLSYRLKFHLAKLRTLFGEINCNARTNSLSGNDGRFDLIYKFHFNSSAYLGIRVKKDSIAENDPDQQIDFYLMAILKCKKSRETKRLRAFSKTIEFGEFKALMLDLSRVASLEHVIETLNKKQLFDFSLPNCLLDQKELEKQFISKFDNDHKIQLVRDELEKIEKDVSEKDRMIKTGQEHLKNNAEYQALIKQRDQINEQIEQFERSVNKSVNEGKNAQNVLGVIKRSAQSLEDTVKKYTGLEQCLRAAYIMQDLAWSLSDSKNEQAVMLSKQIVNNELLYTQTLEFKDFFE